MRPSRCLAPLLSLCLASCASVASTPSAGPAFDEARLLETQQGWWRALAIGDTAFLGANSLPSVSVALSSGRTFDRAALFAQSAIFAGSTPPTFGWSDASVRRVSPDVAIASVRGTEGAALAATTYRYATIFAHDRGAWRVAYAQSTRAAEFTPRLSAAAAGSMADYEGDYRGPRGGVLRIVARDSSLTLIEPSGREIRMEPIGPSLFEFDYLSPAGVTIRFSFARDADGRVVSASRLIPGSINTFLRIPRAQ